MKKESYKLLEPTPVGAFRFASWLTAFGPAWLSAGR
jgi:hypothetical protein